MKNVLFFFKFLFSVVVLCSFIFILNTNVYGQYSINGVCSDPDIHNNCSAGVLGATAEYQSNWQWWCNGTNGGSNILCNEDKIMGVCLPTHYQCSAGTLGWTNDTLSDRWEWWCNGSNANHPPPPDGLFAGFGDILCAEMKPTPTPTPYININVKNPEGVAVSVPYLGFSYGGCGGYNQCWTTIGTDRSSYSTYGIGGENGGGGIALNANQTYLGVTPSVSGGSTNITNNNKCSPGYCTPYNNTNWYNYWWNPFISTGSRSLTFVVGNTTPTPTTAPTSTPTPTPTTAPTSTPTPTNTPTPTPIPAPVLSCSTIPSGINWSWNTWSGIIDYWLQVWGELPWPANDWGYTSPTFTTGTPGVTYSGRVRAGDGTQSSIWSTIVSCTIPVPSPPTLTCGTFDQTGVYTPVTATWANGTSLQVTHDYAPETIPIPASQYWLYNAAALSGITITPPTGKYMPPGHIIYARTTYDGSTFSTTSSVTCPVPADPSSATVSGPLQQKSGTGCYEADATDNFNVQDPTTVTSPSSCVATDCTVSPSNSIAQTYTCTTTFSSNNCLNDDPPTWPTSATVTLTGVAPAAAGYTFIGWTNNSCALPASNTKTVDAGDTVANQPLTFNFSGTNWIKLKNSSFNGVSIAGITVPAFVNNYDTDDDGLEYFISGIGGSVLKTAVLPNSDPLALHYSNPNNWYVSPPYSYSFSMNPSAFLSYVKSRKQYTKISALNQITDDGIYVWDEAVAFPNITNATSIPDYNFVLISTVRPIRILKTNFTPTKSVAIVANSITFDGTTQTANGIFIAQTIDTGSNVTQGLKVKGNLIAQSFTNDRSWSDTSRPSVFIIFDQTQYINLLPYLSIASYDWRQIQ